MTHVLPETDKFEVQQNYRRYIRLKERQAEAGSAYKIQRASKVWIVGVIALVFAAASDFFLGVAAGLFGVYFYSIMRSWFQVSEAAEGVEQLDRWFGSKQLKFEGTILYHRDDQLLETPLDPFDDACFG